MEGAGAQACRWAQLSPGPARQHPAFGVGQCGEQAQFFQEARPQGSPVPMEDGPARPFRDRKELTAPLTMLRKASGPLPLAELADTALLSYIWQGAHRRSRIAATPCPPARLVPALSPRRPDLL